MCFRLWASSLLASLLIASAPGADDPGASGDEQVLKEANVAVDGSGLAQFFKKLTLTEGDAARLKKLIEQLGDDEFETRDKATAQLKEAGPVALPMLREASKNTDPEVARRAQECIEGINKGFAPYVIAAAARVMATKRPAGAAETLLNFLGSTDDDGLADEIRQALVKLAVHDGKADPAIVAALTDKSAARRTAAGVALARAGLPQELPAVRKLLQDAEPIVRLHVAMALAGSKDKDAIPALIELFDSKLPLAQLAPVEEMLYRIADDKQPPTLRGTDDAARKKYREAWAKWWTDNADKVDLAKAEAPRLLGYTLVVLLDLNKILELDGNKKVRWEMTDLQFPLDVQYLPGDRLLVAEQQGGRVTERTLDGKVVWEHKMNEPIVAQRLPNGNTFIAGRNGMIELDPKGTEVFSKNMAAPTDQIMRAQRLPNGDIAYVEQHLNGGGAPEYIHIDARGKELHRFPVNVATFGGRIQVLPNGRVLIPEMYQNKVVEYDTDGKVVWEASVDQPIVATRLANGNTLVTSMVQKKAIELDRDGHPVWEYGQDTRVTLALRR
jgi:HEAT repeat protein